MRVPFNVPTVTGNEAAYLLQAMNNQKLSGDGEFTVKSQKWFQEKFNCLKAMLTTSGTHALEMSALLAEIKEGDEVIMPAFTFVSTANAFVLRGARIVFVDIRPDTMNLDEKLIEGAITNRTKAIVPVHYAGIACEMDTIMQIADKNGLLVIEDACLGLMSRYKGKALGTIGHLGCYSFHETKNFSCGEGGALIINEKRFLERAEILREKGTDRSKFFRGEINKYSWVDLGSSYLLSDLNAAFLYAQIESADAINLDRERIWDLYFEGLKPLSESGYIQLPFIPKDCEFNASLFYLKTRDISERTRLIQYLQENGVSGAFHYIPLHTSPAGKKYGIFNGPEKFTTKESERLLRLPLYYKLDIEKVHYVIELIWSFFKKRET